MIASPESGMYKTIKKLYFEVTSNCNLNCKMCFRHTWINEQHGNMELEIFKKCISDKEALKDLKIVCFGGMGEPLYHPDIIEMVSEAAKVSKNVEMITNGTMLTREMSQKLINAGLTKLWVSLDGVDKNAEDIRQGAKMDIILKNIKEFNEVRYGLGREVTQYNPLTSEMYTAYNTTDVKLGLTFVAMRSNIKHLKQLPEFADEMKADEVHISNVLPNDEATANETLYTRIVEEKMFSPDLVTNCPEYSLPIMDFAIPEVTDVYTAFFSKVAKINFMGNRMHRPVHYCKFVSEGNVFVRWDGDVCPCMGMLHSAKTYLLGDVRTVYHHSFGNVHEQTLNEIWNSAEYDDFRERAVDLEFSFSPCVTCDGICSFREENQQDCYGNRTPTCGACLWGEGVITCP